MEEDHCRSSVKTEDDWNLVCGRASFHQGDHEMKVSSLRSSAPVAITWAVESVPMEALR